MPVRLPSVKTYEKKLHAMIAADIESVVNRIVTDFKERVHSIVSKIMNEYSGICDEIDDLIAMHYAMLTSKYPEFKKAAIELINDGSVMRLFALYTAICSGAEKGRTLTSKIAAAQAKLASIVEMAKGKVEQLTG